MDAHFAAVYGATRWRELRRALAGPIRYVGWVNPFAGGSVEAEAAALAATAGDDWQVHRLCQPAVSGSSTCCAMVVDRGTCPGQLPAPRPAAAVPESTSSSSSSSRRSPSLLLDHYALDGGSALAAMAVDPRGGDSVLDACAAPGGKALVLAGLLARSGGGGVLVCNEKAASRRSRLRSVLKAYLPGPILGVREVAGARRLAAKEAAALHVAVADLDATDQRALRSLPVLFDRILVDAPCSSERHLVRGDRPWSLSRVKRDAKVQLALLRGAMAALRTGGRLVYSTCSIADEENDRVVGSFIERLHRTSPERRLRVDDPLAAIPPELAQGAERTKYGAIVLPDKSGFGPLYWAVLTALDAAAVASQEPAAPPPVSSHERADDEHTAETELEEEEEEEDHEARGDARHGGDAPAEGVLDTPGAPGP